MKTFRCHCGNTLHFENNQCLSCGRILGFLPDELVLSALEPRDTNWIALQPVANGRLYKQCENYSQHNVCNWMVAADDPNPLCTSCRLNRVIPNLEVRKNIKLWYRIEKAKRRCMYTLLDLGLPVISHHEDPASGLAFEFMEDADTSSEFCDNLSSGNNIITGHRSGTITINIAEADPSTREEMREKMNELYRTLLGHFRHEIGHYYWMLLVANTEWLDSARQLFGNELEDYSAALSSYYSNGPRPDWSGEFISAYASAHPWEDWAETWAHYMHIIDTLETANDAGFSFQGTPVTSPTELLERGAQYTLSPYLSKATFDALLQDWIKLTTALNSLNRSMGIQDLYPFILSERVKEKLRFIHQLVQKFVSL